MKYSAGVGLANQSTYSRCWAGLVLPPCCARAGDAAGELGGGGRRDDAVLLAPVDQRRRRDAVGVLLEALVRARPDELADARLRPGVVDLLVRPLGGIVGRAEKALRRLAS